MNQSLDDHYKSLVKLYSTKDYKNYTPIEKGVVYPDKDLTQYFIDLINFHNTDGYHDKAVHHFGRMPYYFAEVVLASVEVICYTLADKFYLQYDNPYTGYSTSMFLALVTDILYRSDSDKLRQPRFDFQYLTAGVKLDILTIQTEKTITRVFKTLSFSTFLQTYRYILNYTRLMYNHPAFGTMNDAIAFSNILAIMQNIYNKHYIQEAEHDT